MKKLLLILCALVCGTLAFAQSYTDNMHVTVNGTDEGVKQGTVTIDYQNDEKTVIDFTLHDFSVEIYMSGWMTLDLGDVTVYDIELGDVDEEDGVAQFSCTDDHHVEYPDIDESFASMVSDVTVNMTGDVSETKLHASMNITVTLGMTLGGATITIGTYPIIANFGYDYGEYLVVNTESGNYLGGGLDWGTHATETDKPQFFSFIEQADGTYLLNGHQANSTSLGLDEDEAEYYIDAVNPHSWVLEEADDGSGYYIGDDDGYLVGNGIYVAVNTTNRRTNGTVWKLVTMDDVLATMDGASISNPVDVTPLIPAPEPKYNSYKDSWTATGYNETAVPNNYCFGGDLGWNASTPLCESYHSTNGFDVRQTISSLPVGYYELTAQAFYRNDGGTVVPSMYITTGTCATDGGYIEKVHLPEHYTESEDMNGAYEEFLEKLYPVTLPFIVDAEGEEFTVGFESNVEDNDQMWSIFGELSLTYLGTDLPTLEVVSGTMNVNVEAAMTAAVATYNSNKTLDNFIAAEEAIIDAEESIAHYEEIAVALASGEYEAVLSTFDEAGQAAFQTDFIEAYEALTLTNETVEDGLAAACKKQTTEFSDMTYALKNSGEWVNAISATSFQLCPQLPTAHEVWSASVWNLGRDVLEKEAIYKQIEDLPAGTYTLSFYAYGSEASDITSKRPLAYATGAEDQEVAYISALGEAWTSASLYTFICEVGEDGILEFGMKSQGEGNWYVMEEYSLIYGAEEEDPYTYNITALLSNPSFEVDDPATEGWDVDYDDSEGSTPRATAADGKGAWTIPIADGKPTGWTITEIAEVCDLMTKEAAATDNGLGSPGEAAEGDYMLYMKKTWGDTDNATVVQTIVLPAGEYKFTVDSKFFSGGATAKLVVGDESEDIHVNATTATTDILSETAWTTNTLTFTLDETTELTIGVQMSFPNTSPGSILLDNFQLFSTEEVETVSYDYDVTWALANPSFEVDNVVANLTVDETRSVKDEDGNLVTASAWKVTSLTGWTLPTLSSGFGVSDLMTKDAADTDNNFGVPGDPSNGSQMLYIRDAWLGSEEDVKLTQELTLPAGDYKIAVDTKCVGTSTATGTLFAGDKSKALTIHGTSNGTDDTKTNPFLDAWDTATLTFSLDEETTVSVGIEFDFPQSAANGSFLIDNFKLLSAEEITKTISWTMTDAGWGTMILPFDATLDGLTAYSCAGTEESTDEDGNDITVVSLTEVGTSITANTPYIVSGTADTYTFTGTPTNTVETYTEGIITGTLVDLAVAKGAAFATDGTNYVLQNHDDEGLAFYPIIAATEDAENSAEATLDAYHCYLDLSLVTTSARPVALHFPGAGEATGIVAVESDLIANDAIYDLSGRKVSKAVKGVYIINGKKVLVK